MMYVMDFFMIPYRTSFFYDFKKTLGPTLDFLEQSEVH